MTDCKPIYTQLTDPYSKLTDPYSKLCAPNEIFFIFQDNNQMLFMDGNQVIFN